MELIIKGMVVSGSLIMAIGSQNIFVLKQGLLKKNIFSVVLICFACDFFLIFVGVLGLGSIISKSVLLTTALAISGALFLFFYGYKSFLSSFKSSSTINLKISSENEILSRKNIILATLAITLLNPHVYLDTVVIVGGIAGTLSFSDKMHFLIGALLSSFIWFFGLGYGSRLLSPIFQSQRSWRILEFLIGLIMWWISYELLMFAF